MKINYKNNAVELSRGIARETNHLKRHTIELIAIVILGAVCPLTSYAEQNSTAKTPSISAAFVTANSRATHGEPATVQNIRKAEEADERWRTYHFGWYGHP
jgi:hypothetical protein